MLSSTSIKAPHAYVVLLPVTQINLQRHAASEAQCPSSSSHVTVIPNAEHVQHISLAVKSQKGRKKKGKTEMEKREWRATINKLFIGSNCFRSLRGIGEY